MALDVARGMAALEVNDPPIVHRDLKPTNIFIDAGQSVEDLGSCHVGLCMTHEVSRVAAGRSCHLQNNLLACHS